MIGIHWYSVKECELSLVRDIINQKPFRPGLGMCIS